MFDVIMRNTTFYSRSTLHILWANVGQVTDHTAVQERVEIGIWKFLPSQIYRVEIAGRKNQEFRFLFLQCQREVMNDFGQGLGGSKAHNWLFLYSLGTECTENTSSCSYSAVGCHDCRLDPHRKHLSQWDFHCYAHYCCYADVVFTVP
jgi:hypothetical protein